MAERFGITLYDFKSEWIDHEERETYGEAVEYAQENTPEKGYAIIESIVHQPLTKLTWTRKFKSMTL